MEYKDIIEKYNLLDINGKLNNNYKKIFTKMSSIDQQRIIDSYGEYTELVDKLLSIKNGQYKYCPICQNIMSWKIVNKTCSRKCANESIKKEYKKTCIEKYGVKNTILLDSVREKRKKTNIERYGYENATKNKAVKEKTRKTNNKRYGGNSPQSDPKIREKSVSTNLEKYGTRNPMQTKEVQDKQKKTMMERHGVEHATQNPEILKRLQQTNLERCGHTTNLLDTAHKEHTKKVMLEKYGVDHPSKSEVIYEKIKQTTFDNYGVECIFTHKDCIDKKLKAVNQNKINFIKSRLGIEISSEESDLLKINTLKNYSDKYLLELIDYICNGNQPNILIFRDEFNSSRIKEVANKYGHDIKSSTSTYEAELIQILDEFGIKYKTNVRSIITPYELDIYIPEHNLAIEFNGSYWHSDKFVDKNYHQMKTKMCNELGITLIHIHEYMYINKSSIYKSIIKSKLNLNERVYARKCILKEVSKQEEKDFLDKYHLQGFVGSNKCYGLYFNDDLLTLCSFGKSRFNKKYEYELLRNCTKPNITVVGGLSKIIKHYKNEINNKDIVCYSDASISYNKNSDLTSPNYVWIKNNSVLKRYQTMKHKLEKILKENFDCNLSESENMKKNGFCRVYDSGNYITIY